VLGLGLFQKENELKKYIIKSREDIGEGEVGIMCLDRIRERERE